MKFNSIKFKVGNLFTIILGIILILYSAFLQVSLSKYLINDLDEDISAKVNEIGNIISDELAASAGEDLNTVIQRIFSFQYPPKSSLIAVKKKKTGGEPLSDEEKWFVRFDRLDLSQDMLAFFELDGNPIFSSQNIPQDVIRKFIPSLKSYIQDDSFKDVTIHKKYYRQVQSVISLPNGRQIVVLIASSEKPIIDLLRHRQHLFMVSIPIILLVTAFLGRFLADRILRPVNNIVLMARQIGSRDLSKRLRADDVDEEMKVLADSFNDMIARLENSFKHIEEFSSQVAHELKTPLAILRGETEVALRMDQSAPEYKRVLKENMDEIEKIIRVVEDLLLLAKLDYRPEFLRFERFDFKEFFNPILDKAKLLAEERNIEVICAFPKDEIFIEGDSLHLRRLFFNIIHNAIKFTPTAQKISIKIFKEGSALKISISDKGVGIPEEYLSSIFDRFFQVPMRDENPLKGSGLGLNIAQSVAKAHQGKIEVQSQIHQGSIFIVTLPLA
ncbi:MAG: HAMP domain-containing protein [Candidatus Omnitrophica bacterium]|nr:HAMP domain-containing protein [Candidatus Omnitrophota bacterium]